MKDRVHKWIYISPLDMNHFEGWLEELAQKGLFFEWMTSWGVTFSRREPTSMRYRLEPAGRLWTRESGDYCRELGWTRLGPAGPHFNLYANSDPEAPELHTDPVVQSYALDLLARRLRRHCILLAAVTLLLAVLVALALTHFPILNYLVDSANARNLFLPLFDLLILITALRTYHSFFRLRRQMADGAPPRRDGSWRGRLRWGKITLLAELAVLLLYIGLLAAVIILPWSAPLDDLNRPVPIYSLAELENDPTLEAPPDGGAADLAYHKNSVAYKWTPAVPQQYRIRQYLSNGQDYEAELYIYWYRPAISALAAPLMEELVSQNAGNTETRTLDPPGLDRAVLAPYAHTDGQRLFLLKDDVAVWLDYTGKQDLTKRPDLLEGLCEFEP